MRSPEDLEAEVGHPGEIYDELLQTIQARGVTQFVDIEEVWLRLLWSMDSHRIAGIAPRGMGKQTVDPIRRLGAIYRNKGNWFAKVVATLLQQRTGQEIAAQSEIIGFSQPHQIDVSWPARNHDPLVCIETKVTGAPGFGSTPVRSALADWSNRRKEIKFAATDLKLYRRQQETAIEHWGVWRSAAPPKTYVLWAARLRTETRPDNLQTLLRECQVLTDTYVEGAGIVAWQMNAAKTAYEMVRLPASARVTSMDDVLYRVATEIKHLAPQGTPPPPHTPEREVEGARNVVKEPEA